jgi:gliding motility-associated-like protein
MVSGTDLNGCHDSDFVTISVIQRKPVSIDTGGAFCIGGSMELQATGGSSYIWSPAAGLSCTDCATPTASPVVTTTYSVIIRQGWCFADTLSTTVVVHQLPTVNAGPDQSIILGSYAQIKVTGTDISKYSWTPYDGLSCTDCANPTTSPATNTTYVVTVASEFGCTASDDIKINVRCDDAQVWMPNTFTPNADGQNDFFYPHGKGLSQITRFRIYDRWGELIFDRMNMPVNDRSNGWDGTYKNQTLKPDVFVWILNAICTNGEPLELKGDISLIR